MTRKCTITIEFVDYDGEGEKFVSLVRDPLKDPSWTSPFSNHQFDKVRQTLSIIDEFKPHTPLYMSPKGNGFVPKEQYDEERKETELKELNEPILQNDYQIYAGYMYVADSEVIKSDVFGTVKDLKIKYGYGEIRRCDIKSRNLFNEMI